MSVHYTCEVEGCGKQTNNLAEWMTLTIAGCVESIVMHACCVAHMQVVCGSLAAAAAQHVAKPKEPWDP